MVFWLSRLKTFFTKNSLILKIGLVILLIVPIIFPLIYISTYAVNVPYWDQYEVIPLFDKLYSGNLSVVDLVAQHNEHRIALPHLLMLGLGTVTHYNVIAEEYLAWFFILLTCILILIALIKAYGFNQSTIVKFIPVPWLLFSLRQSPTYLWGYQLNFPMTIFFGALALYLLVTSKNIGWRLGVAILSGIACTLSMTNGLLIWIIGLLQILYYFRFRKQILNRPHFLMAAIWGFVGVVVFIMYFIGFAFSENSPSPFYIFGHPKSAVLSLLACVGSPLSSNLYAAAIFGGLFLVLFLWVFIMMVKKETEPQPFTTFSFSLAIFGLASVGLIVVGRAGFGYMQMLDAHYITLTMLTIIGGYLLLTSIKHRFQNIKPFLKAGLLGLVIAATLLSIPQAIEAGNGEKTWWPINGYYLSNYEIQSDSTLLTLFSDAQIVRNDAAILKKYNLSVFSEPALELQKLAVVTGNTSFSMDAVNGIAPSLANNHLIIIDSQNVTTLTVTGWAIDLPSQKAAGGVFINVDGQKDYPAFYGLDRPDIAAFFGGSSYQLSGYFASFATSLLEKGPHTLSLKIVTADKAGYYASEGKIYLEIK